MSKRNLLFLSAFALSLALRADSLDSAFGLVRKAVENNEVPGAIALVARDGRIVQQEAFGLRDIENQLPFTTNTLCWIASITKPVTAAAAMTLVDSGKIGLDDPVEKYLPEFREQKDTNGAHHAFTIRQLMSHTSGLVPNPPTRRSGWPIGGPLDDFWLQQNLPAIVGTIARSQLRFKPGSKFEYSNSAFFVLGRVIEVVSGTPYAVFLKEKILDPLGMTDTHYAPPRAEAKRVAKIYARRDGKRETIFHFNPAVKISNTAPDGGLFSYPTQLVPFLQMFLDNDGRVLSRVAVTQMLTPQPHGWGLGWSLQDGMFQHEGSSGTVAWADPKTGTIGILFLQYRDENKSDERLRKSFREAVQKAFEKTNVTVQISTPMQPPTWAVLERRVLAESVPACREFLSRYFDQRGYLQCFVRWGANDGPDDAFENFNSWPELHALGASDEILRMYLTGWEGMLKQYAEAKTVEVPIAREGMYHQEFCVQADWMHLGEGLQLFNRMGLSVPTDTKYQERARRFAGFYMNEPNYDARRKIIRSMLNGSKGPMLRKATALDWVGDSFDVRGFVALHGERTFEQFLAHYEEYTDVVGDNCLNLVATTLPLNAYLLAHEAKYKQWILDYMDAWVDRMKQNRGIIPSYVDLDGKVGGPEGKWWGNAYGWGFSPVNPVNGRRENRHRIPRALVGFNNALWVSGDQKYVDAWRNMINAVNAYARTNNGRVEYPTMHGEQGWYGWQSYPWDIGALEVYYWSMKPDDLKRVTDNDWIAYLQGKDASYPEAALQRDLQRIQSRVDAMRRDSLPPEKRLADNMLHLNPAATASLVQLMWGGLPPGVDGGLVNARLRYFDPARKRAGVPEDLGALVSRLTDRETDVTLVNLNKTEPRTVIVQGGAYGEHQFESVTTGEKTTRIDSALLTVQLNPGSGERLTLRMKRYANPPTVLHPWQAKPKPAAEVAAKMRPSETNATTRRKPAADPLPTLTEQFTKMETVQVGEFAIDLCRREDGAFGLGEIRRGNLPIRRADFLVNWQVAGKSPVFERRNGLTIWLRNPAATLTFTPEQRECAGTTFAGFRVQFKAERGPIVETASWELGGATRGLAYFDGYRGWHAPPQWMRAEAVPMTNPKLMPSLLQGTGFQFEHGNAGALLHFHTSLGDRLRNVSRGEALEFQTTFDGPATVDRFIFVASGDSRINLWSRAYEVAHAELRRALRLSEREPEIFLQWPSFGRKGFRETVRQCAAITAQEGFTGASINVIWDNADFRGGAKSMNVWDYTVCEGYGGESGLKGLTDECKRNNLRVIAWMPAGHLWSKSPVWENHPDWILLNQRGEKFVNPAGGIWHGALDTGFHDYFRDGVLDAVRRFGLDGLWLDTHLSYAQQMRPPDHAARLAQMYCDFARAGARHLLVEGDASAIGSYAIAIGDDWEKKGADLPEPDLYYGAMLAAGSMNPRFYLNHFPRYVAAGAPWIINWDFLFSSN